MNQVTQVPAWVSYVAAFGSSSIALLAFIGVLVTVRVNRGNGMKDRTHDAEQREKDRAVEASQRQRDREQALDAVRLTLADAKLARDEERAEAQAKRAEERETARSRRFEQRILDMLPDFENLDRAASERILALNKGAEELSVAQINQICTDLIYSVERLEVYAETQATNNSVERYVKLIFELWARCREYVDAEPDADGLTIRRPLPDLKPWYAARSAIIWSFRTQIGLATITSNEEAPESYFDS